MEKRNIQIELTLDKHDKLKNIADIEHRTMKATIEMVVLKWLDTIEDIREININV